MISIRKGAIIRVRWYVSLLCVQAKMTQIHQHWVKPKQLLRGIVNVRGCDLAYDDKHQSHGKNQQQRESQPKTQNRQNRVQAKDYNSAKKKVVPNRNKPQNNKQQQTFLNSLITLLNCVTSTSNEQRTTRHNDKQNFKQLLTGNAKDTVQRQIGLENFETSELKRLTDWQSTVWTPSLMNKENIYKMKISENYNNVYKYETIESKSSGQPGDLVFVGIQSDYSLQAKNRALGIIYNDNEPVACVLSPTGTNCVFKSIMGQYQITDRDADQEYVWHSLIGLIVMDKTDMRFQPKLTHKTRFINSYVDYNDLVTLAYQLSISCSSTHTYLKNQTEKPVITAKYDPSVYTMIQEPGKMQTIDGLLVTPILNENEELQITHCMQVKTLKIKSKPDQMLQNKYMAIKSIENYLETTSVKKQYVTDFLDDKYNNFYKKYQKLKNDYEQIHSQELTDKQFIEKISKSSTIGKQYCEDSDDLIIYMSLVANFTNDGRLIQDESKMERYRFYLLEYFEQYFADTPQQCMQDFEDKCDRQSPKDNHKKQNQQRKKWSYQYEKQQIETFHKTNEWLLKQPLQQMDLVKRRSKGGVKTNRFHLYNDLRRSIRLYLKYMKQQNDKGIKTLYRSAQHFEQLILQESIDFNNKDKQKLITLSYQLYQNESNIARMIKMLKDPMEDISDLKFTVPLTEIGLHLLCDYSKADSIIHTQNGTTLTRKYEMDVIKIQKIHCVNNLNEVNKSPIKQIENKMENLKELPKRNRSRRKTKLKEIDIDIAVGSQPLPFSEDELQIITGFKQQAEANLQVIMNFMFEVIRALVICLLLKYLYRIVVFIFRIMLSLPYLIGRGETDAFQIITKFAQYCVRWTMNIINEIRYWVFPHKLLKNFDFSDVYNSLIQQTVTTTMAKGIQQPLKQVYTQADVKFKFRVKGSLGQDQNHKPVIQLGLHLRDESKSLKTLNKDTPRQLFSVQGNYIRLNQDDLLQGHIHSGMIKNVIPQVKYQNNGYIEQDVVNFALSSGFPTGYDNNKTSYNNAHSEQRFLMDAVQMKIRETKIADQHQFRFNEDIFQSNFSTLTRTIHEPKLTQEGIIMNHLVSSFPQGDIGKVITQAYDENQKDDTGLRFFSRNFPEMKFDTFDTEKDLNINYIDKLPESQRSEELRLRALIMQHYYAQLKKYYLQRVQYYKNKYHQIQNTKYTIEQLQNSSHNGIQDILEIQGYMDSKFEHIIKNGSDNNQYVCEEAQKSLSMKTMNRHFYTQLLHDVQFRALIGLAYGAFDINQDINLVKQNQDNERIGSIDIKPFEDTSKEMTTNVDKFFKNNVHKLLQIAIEKETYCKNIMQVYNMNRKKVKFQTLHIDEHYVKQIIDQHSFNIKMVLNFISNPSTTYVISVGDVTDTHIPKMHDVRNDKRRQKYIDYREDKNGIRTKAHTWVPGSPEILIIEDDLQLDRDLTTMSEIAMDLNNIQTYDVPAIDYRNNKKNQIATQQQYLSQLMQIINCQSFKFYLIDTHYYCENLINNVSGQKYYDYPRLEMYIAGIEFPLVPGFYQGLGGVEYTIQSNTVKMHTPGDMLKCYYHNNYIMQRDRSYDGGQMTFCNMTLFYTIITKEKLIRGNNMNTFRWCDNWQPYGNIQYTYLSQVLKEQAKQRISLDAALQARRIKGQNEWVSMCKNCQDKLPSFKDLQYEPCQEQIQLINDETGMNSKIYCHQSDEAKFRFQMLKYILHNSIIQSRDDKFLYLTYYLHDQLKCEKFEQDGYEQNIRYNHLMARQKQLQVFLYMHLFREEEKRHIRQYEVSIDVPINAEYRRDQVGCNTLVQISNVYAMSGTSKQDVLQTPNSGYVPKTFVYKKHFIINDIHKYLFNMGRRFIQTLMNGSNVPVISEKVYFPEYYDLLEDNTFYIDKGGVDYKHMLISQTEAKKYVKSQVIPIAPHLSYVKQGIQDHFNPKLTTQYGLIQENISHEPVRGDLYVKRGDLSCGRQRRHADLKQAMCEYSLQNFKNYISQKAQGRFKNYTRGVKGDKIPQLWQDVDIVAYIDYQFEYTKHLENGEKNMIKEYIRTELSQQKWNDYDDLIVKIHKSLPEVKNVDHHQAVKDTMTFYTNHTHRNQTIIDIKSDPETAIEKNKWIQNELQNNTDVREDRVIQVKGDSYFVTQKYKKPLIENCNNLVHCNRNVAHQKNLILYQYGDPQYFLHKNKRVHRDDLQQRAQRRLLIPKEKLIRKGQEVWIFEFDSTNAATQFGSIVDRQFGSNTKPIMSEVHKLNKLCDIWYQDMEKQISKERFKMTEEEFMETIPTPFSYTQGQNFSLRKKNRYLKSIVDYMFKDDYNKTVGSFMSMAKKGEVHSFLQGSDTYLKDGYIYNTSKSPRNIANPAKVGMAQFINYVYLQTLLLPKSNSPATRGAIIGLNCEQIQERIDTWRLKSHNPKTSKPFKTNELYQLSWDGKRFDSTQFTSNIKAVDIPFLKMFSPIIKQSFQKTFKTWGFTPSKFDTEQKMDKMMSNILKDICLTNHRLYVHTPGLWDTMTEPQQQWAKKQWTTQVQREFKSEHSNQSSPWKDYMFYDIEGTVLSGHGIRTTLGNTLRSLAYAYYYIQYPYTDKYGKLTQLTKKPWDDDRFFVMASGDDLVIVGDQDILSQIRLNALKLTARDKSQQISIGLGQVVEEIPPPVTIYKFDFLSKVSYWNGDRWALSPNPKKVLEKMIYTGQNAILYNSMWLYYDVIYDNLKRQQLSLKLEDIVLARRNACKPPDFTSQKLQNIYYRIKQHQQNQYKKQHTDTETFNYEFSDIVEKDLSITFNTILGITFGGCIAVGSQNRNTFSPQKAVVDSEVNYMQVKKPRTPVKKTILKNSRYTSSKQQTPRSRSRSKKKEGVIQKSRSQRSLSQLSLNKQKQSTDTQKQLATIQRLLTTNLLNKNLPYKQGLQVGRIQSKPKLTKKSKRNRGKNSHMVNSSNITQKNLLVPQLKNGNGYEHTAQMIPAHKTNQTRPPYEKGQLVQANYKQVLSAWDKMCIAKHYPGTFNAQYVAGMNVSSLPTMTFSVSNTFSKCNQHGVENFQPFGTTDYLLIMYSTSQTAFFGTGTAGNISAANKQGGMVFKQFTANNLTINCIDRSYFNRSDTGLTMLQAYGSEFTGFSSGGYIWSGKATMNIIAPAACMVGSYYKGTLAWGQIPLDSANNTIGLSLENLIHIASEIEVMDAQFTLETAVINNDLVYDSQNAKETANSSAMVGELVNYVILQQPVQTITDPGDKLYSLQANFTGNGVFWGKAQDAFANNLFKRFKGDQAKESPMPNVLQTINPRDMNERSLSARPRTFWQAAQELLHSGFQFANENKDSILAAGKVAANLLAKKHEFALETGEKENDILEKPIDTIPIADYNAQLERLVNVLLQMQQMNLLFCSPEIKYLLHLCQIEKESVNKNLDTPGEISTGRFKPKVIGFEVETYSKLIEKDPYRNPCIPDDDSSSDEDSSDSSDDQEVYIQKEDLVDPVQQGDILSISDKIDGTLTDKTQSALRLEIKTKADGLKPKSKK